MVGVWEGRCWLGGTEAVVGASAGRVLLGGTARWARRGAGCFRSPFALNMTIWPRIVIMPLALISLRRVLKQYTPSPHSNRINQLNRKLRIPLEAIPITQHILLTLRVHNLSRRNLCHQPPKRRPRVALAVYLVDLLGVGHEARFTEAFAVLIHGDVLQLWHLETGAEEVEFVTADGVLVFALRVWHVGDIV